MIAATGQVIADNPAQMIMVASGTIVVTRILANAMKPRGLAETVALMVVANAICCGGAAWLTGKGYLTWRVRDEEGCLVPLTFAEGAPGDDLADDH